MHSPSTRPNRVTQKLRDLPRSSSWAFFWRDCRRVSQFTRPLSYTFADKFDSSYTIGALSLSSACKVAYYRGQLTGKLRETATSSSAMISVNIPAHEVEHYLGKTGLSSVVKSVQVACINSPLNSTLSGLEDEIDIIKKQLDNDAIFAQKLKTGIAYHSSVMRSIAEKYSTLLGSLEPGELNREANPSMFSSVTGNIIERSSLGKAQYWVDNLVLPVRFCEALENLAARLSGLSDVVEIGPHSALRRPVQDILRNITSTRDTVRYSSVLNRSKSPVHAVFELLGHLFSHGHQVHVSAANQHEPSTPLLVDCPEYPFDHSHKYWAESRLSRNYRSRGPIRSDMLGVQANDWNSLEPKWRNFWSVQSTPWIGDHSVSRIMRCLSPGLIKLCRFLE